MIDWHLVAELVAPGGSVFLGAWRILARMRARDREYASAQRERDIKMAYRLGRQDEQLEWQSRALESMAVKTGSHPPPRPKLTTLSDPWEEIDAINDATLRSPPPERTE